MKNRPSRVIVYVLLLLAAAACSPARGADQALPTQALLPSNYRLEDAERVARDYLTAWERDDLETMYRWISFASREANPREEFDQLYETAAETMGLEGVAIRPITLSRRGDAVALFAYDASFTTRLIGVFTDSARNLTLVVDQQANEWRVAWTPDDLFAGMRDGARLVYRSTVPNRANIYDRDGDVLADQSGRAVKVQIVRQQVPDYPTCLATLSTALERPQEDVRTLIDTRPADWLLDLGAILPEAYSATSVALEASCAATFEGVPTRHYADGTVAPHILGYVGYPAAEEVPALEAQGFTSESIIGRSGIEAIWDVALRGMPGGALTLVDPAGRVLRALANVAPQPGQSLWLTFDSDFQRRAAQIVADAFRAARGSWAETSTGASAVVIDPNTGEILALVSYPTFDNRAYTPYPEMGKAQAQAAIQRFQSDPLNPEVNRPVQGVFPLGSVMKTVSAAAAADSGVYALNQRYTCSGIWTRDITRYDHVSGGHGLLTLASSLTQSCNPYYYEVGYQLDQVDPYLLPTYARRLGFGGPTGLTDLPENPGRIPDPDWLRTNYGEDWRFSESVNLAVGQGYMGVTPLQVARWFSAIANGGALPRPSLVREVGLIGEPLTRVNTPVMTPTDLKPEVIETIRSGLCAVTLPGGTADFVFRDSQLQGLGVCGKTGTAQTGGPDTPSDAWFASFAPRENPQVVVVVMVQTAGQGSEIAAPIARQLLEAYFGLS
ncbi:MAG: hypothetical protein L6Q98_17350 [Anaerolineae bacterium]|nr:hypothetical protein [Anaerolineae bacterium]NUQ06544.1 hypothetical protein [Anaerolineae bacterium]